MISMEAFRCLSNRHNWLTTRSYYLPTPNCEIQTKGGVAVVKATYLASLRTDSAALVGAVRLGSGAPVPSCPGWLVADVAIHVGAVHRQWARLLRDPGTADPLGLRRELIRRTLPGALEWFERPEASRADPEGAPVGVASWLEEGAALLVAAFGEADPDHPLVLPAAGLRLEIPALLRGLAAETAVHCWDAQAAHGRQTPIDRELAEDGIGAMFAETIPNHRAWAREHAEAPPPEGRGEAYLFRQTDGGGSGRCTGTGIARRSVARRRRRAWRCGARPQSCTSSCGAASPPGRWRSSATPHCWTGTSSWRRCRRTAMTDGRDHERSRTERGSR